MPDWEPFNKIAGWFFAQTKLSYFGQPVLISAFDAKEVVLFKINERKELIVATRTTMSVESAARYLEPLEQASGDIRQH